MASFQEVMRQWNRMCGKQGHCCTCPADGPCPTDGPCSPVSDLCTNVERITALEEAIMRWAEEHPEPVYPTWYDWFAGLGFDPDDPIPADIAQKLGLEPKEVKA